MAKKYYDGDITLSTDWGGDESTGNLPVVGHKVQEIIKDSINSKVGYVGLVEKTGQGFYVLSRDEQTFNLYKNTITEDKPFGDLSMDGINGRFDAPFNYKMNITLITPETGYKSTLLGSTGNIIKFRTETLDNNNTPQGESVTITFKIKNESGVETSHTAIYDGNIASQGIEYNLDGKLGSGINTVTINAVGMNTGISAMRKITYRIIDMYFNDKFNIAKRYQFTDKGTLAMTVGYDLKGVGKTNILWYFDGILRATDEISNLNPILNNSSHTFYFTENTDVWLTPGIHNIQMTMICKDVESGEDFQTPIYYREFIIEKTPTVLTTPYIVRKTYFDNTYGILTNGDIPTIYNAKQFENIDITYAVYFNGKSECNVTSYITYNNEDLIEITSEKLPLELDDFSHIQTQLVNLTQEGSGTIVLRAFANDNIYFESLTNLKISPSDMNISTVEDSVLLYLNAFGRSNNTSNRDIWAYTYKNEFNEEITINTSFSKNEYVIISTYDNNGNIIAPNDATITNSLIVEELPLTENEEYKYLVYEGVYYIWSREFDWSDTSGWSDNKLKISNGNSITIDFEPFSEENTAVMKERGATFEFEFETTNVYNDDAVICRICGNENFAPGISIYASGAELVLSREVITGDNSNSGYTKKVSTKYKSEESNRISFVVTPDSDDEDYRNRILSIYVNGELCGAYAYDKGARFTNNSKIIFRGSEDACVNISSIKIYSKALSSNEILNNYIYYRNNSDEKNEIYKRNDIMLPSNNEFFDSDKLKSQLPVMMIYQTDINQSLDDIHQEKKNKKLTRFFDVVYIDIQNPNQNFLVKNAYITPQGTSSMNYPVKNLRLYTGKKDKSGNYYSRLFVGSNIFKDGSPSNLSWDNINLETEVKKKREYSFKEGAIPVNCWCLKADFAESSSSHNTGTSRYWNQVLKNAGFTTKAQIKATKYAKEYPYDIRTAIDGFPIVVFYQQMDSSAPRFEGKYNFNNDKSTESVFGFTGGIEIPEQEVKYYYIGKEKPIVHGEENDDGEWEWACEFAENYNNLEHPTSDSPLYASDNNGNWYMLRGKELLDNPKMECWELLNSVNDIALFKTMIGFGVGDDDEKIGIVDGDKFDEAFESRYPDCGDYYHYNSLKRFGEWLVSCRYLDIDNETGKSVPFTKASLPIENYHLNDNKKLSICSLTKQTGEFEFNFPGMNFYTPIDYNLIASNIKNEGYQQISVTNEILETIEFIDVDVLPSNKLEDYEYIRCEEVFYTWMPSNVLKSDIIPDSHESAYDYILVGDTYYVWSNKYRFEDYHETQWVDDTAFNRALKFAVEKYDHIEMNKMAAYYIYLMRFGGVDQTVKNSMLTTEGPAVDDPTSDLPSLWFFINYDNDTILGVKNDGRLVFDPYITRETKDGTGYVYAGRESTLWNNLEADAQFMEKVTEVDNKLSDGTSNPLYSLSYTNALREYDTNQSDKWCERIYNKDAERKYIDTYVKGWVQKNDAEHTETHVYEDYLYDVQGSRSAHRKWWLGRRFNVFDSRFCNTNFRNSLIKFRSTNLPSGSSFTIKSGEPIFYAWGHDNAVTEMTPTAIQPGDMYTFTTKSAFNIGSYLELMGAANISTLNLRNCVGALTEIDVTGCYSSSIGTKMKEILIGDNKRNDLINISNTNLKLSGLGNAQKLEILDITNIQNATSVDGLSSLLNIREVYAKGTSVSNFTFADGAMIEKLELPISVETLSLTRCSNIKYESILFENNDYSKLKNLVIDNCAYLMDNTSFILKWLGSKTLTQRKDLSINLQGINWTFDINNFQNLFVLEGIKPEQRNIRGIIEITTKLDISQINRLKGIFGNECFKEGSKVYIKAPTGLYVNSPDVLWEGESNVKIDITTVGTTLDGELILSATVNEIIDGESVNKIIESTNGVITLDTSNVNKGYVLVNIAESNNLYERFILTVTYHANNGFEMVQYATPLIQKRIYPELVQAQTLKKSYNNKTNNPLTIKYTPDTINDVNLIGRGYFNVDWTMVGGSEGYKNAVTIHDKDKEIGYIQAPNGFDGTVEVMLTITRNYDSKPLCTSTINIEFTNPDTIITKTSNEPLYNILVNYGIIKESESEDGTKFGKLTKGEAALLTMDDIIDSNNKSIFANNTSLISFTEFQYFSNTLMGQMPQDGIDNTITPDGLFEGCSNLEEISFSSNFAYTGKNMFKGCNKLKHIYGPYWADDENGNPIYTNLSFVDIGDNFASGCSLLETCLLSATCKKIGVEAFKNCTSLREFQMPTGEGITISHSINSTPFIGCKNISFAGSEYGDISTSNIQVKNGACYIINADNSISLLHMGKDTLMSDIPKDKTVYACAHSMESRTEKHLVIPENIIFNGVNILTNSKGESLTLKCIIGNNVANGLFKTTSFKGNYYFAKGETTLPQQAFYDVKDINKFIVPEGIQIIYSQCFYSSSIQEIHFPSTLLSTGSDCFWLSGLKRIYFNGNTPPLISTGDFFNIMPEAFYVDPQYINTYRDVYKNDKNKAFPLIVPFFKINHLYNEGYIRIIKDGNYIFNDDEHAIKVGDIDVQNIEGSDYMKYFCDNNVSNIKVSLNDEIIGEIDDMYTTIYIGDNSKLFIGDGINFEHGIYNDEIQQILDNSGWFYDKRFKGVRSNPNYSDISNSKTEITLSLPSYINTSTNITFGQYSYTTINKNKTYGYIKDSNDNIIFSTDQQQLGYYQETNIKTSDGIFTFGFTNDSTIKTGINGIVLNKIGNSIYSDPEITTQYSQSINNMTNTRVITINLNADVVIPNHVYVTVTDNKAHTYRKYWDGEPLLFNIPIGYDFIVSASEFVSTTHKKYFINEPISIENDFIDLTYVKKSGINLTNNIISCYDNDRDWFIDITKYSSPWGTMGINVSDVNIDEVVLSDADGYNNTILISNKDKNSICYKALFEHKFSKELIGYIPSYIDFELFKLILPEINHLLSIHGKETLNIDNCWLSESYNEDYAWTTDGNKIAKTNNLNYLVFGKYII